MTNEIILKYQAYIYSLTKYFKNYPNKEDLYQVGCIGLINAYNNYDESKGAKFTTYAFPYILGEMYKLVREDKNIKVSPAITKLNLKIEKASILLAQKLSRYPTIKELSLYLHIDENLISECLNINKPVMSIDYEMTDDKNITLEDVVGVKKDLDTLILLKEEIENLKEPDKTIMKRHLENYTQSEIASALGLNQVKVSRTISSVKQKIKAKVA